MKYCPQCANELLDRVIGGISRLACPSSECGFVHWNNPIPVVAGLIQRDGKRMLCHQLLKYRPMLTEVGIHYV